MNSKPAKARLVSIGTYAAALALLAALIATAALTAFDLLHLASQRATVASADTSRSKPPHQRATTTSGRVILTQDDWVERIQRRDYWEGRGGVGSGPSRPNGVRASAPLEKPSKLGAGSTSVPGQVPPVSSREASRSSSSGADWDGTYRTMCVRLCDGYFFPVSFSTNEDNFERDQARCQASCGSPARLFVYKNPGEEIEEMQDLDGAPYTRLKTAFLFRQKYDSACKCTPHPWEPQALERHRLYALETAGKKGDKVAAKAANELKTKIGAEDRRLNNQKKPGKVQSADDGTVGSGLEGARSSARSQKGKKKQFNPAASAARDAPNGSRTGDMMRLGAARSNGQLRSSGGKPTSANRNLHSSRRPAWQAVVFERY